MVGKVLGKIRYMCFPTEREKILKEWYFDDGDRTLRLDYNLNKESIVIDAGGYWGQWSSDIFSMYCCQIFIFEPVRRFAEKIEYRFRGNSNIRVLPCGVGGITRTEKIALRENGSSIFRASDSTEDIRIIDIVQWMLDKNIEKVDLMKINIEGGEYEVMERLLDTGVIRRIQNVQIQFHPIDKDSLGCMSNIQERLAETHHLTYQYRFVWENWSINNPPSV